MDQSLEAEEKINLKCKKQSSKIDFFFEQNEHLFPNTHFVN